MKVGDRVVLTACGEARIEDAARSVHAWVHGAATNRRDFAIPCIVTGAEGVLRKSIGNGMFECLFGRQTILVSEDMVDVLEK